MTIDIDCRLARLALVPAILALPLLAAGPQVAPSPTPTPGTKVGDDRTAPIPMQQQVPDISPTRTLPAPGQQGQPIQVQPQGMEPLAPLDPRQAIKFEPTVLELGEMIADTAKTGSITVVNILDKPIKITRIIPGCGCTTTGAPPGEIPPGGKASVDITLKPGSKPGVPLSKTVTFQIEGHAPQLLTVKGDVKAFVLMTPDIIDGPATPDSPPGSLKLSSADGVPFKVTGMVPDVAVAMPADARTEHELQIDWKKWEAAGSSVKLAVMTDNPKAPQLTAIVKRALRPGEVPTKAPVQSSAPAIVLAARSGDVPGLKAAIATGAGVDLEDPMSRRTALHFAADSGNMEAIALLIEAKASPNAKDRTGKTPVTIAAERGRAAARGAVLKAGGDAGGRGLVQGSPLLWAAGLGTPETVQVLLDAGSDANIADVNGMTPLMWAAGVGKPENVSLLLAKGADTKAVDKITGENAFMRALRSGKGDTVRILIGKSPDMAARNLMGMTPFLIACAYSDPEKIKMVMDAGADKAAKDNRGWGAIDHARNRVDSRRDEVVRMLEPIVPASTVAPPPATPAAAAEPSK
ncbi:MAG: ankyrin repeat domain-containing protein [Phycisphaerales bacterium]